MSNRNRNGPSTIDAYSLEPDGDPREGGGERPPRERLERRAAWRGRWREAALNEALRRDDGYGDEATNVVLANAREWLPGSTQVILRGADKCAALNALREEIADFRSIVVGNLLHRSSGGEVPVPYAGWYGFEWKDEWVEAAIPPARFSPNFVFISESREAVESVARCVHERTARPEGQCMTYSGGKWRGAPDMDAEVSKVSWEDIVLPPKTILEIRGSVERFFERREAYRALDLAWRRGILLVGPPGTGKTMVCKAIAASAPELPFLYVRDIDAADDEREIGAVFGRARSLAPSILVFEDIDGLVNEANRSVFLNELDGFKSNDGVLVVASSNHPERIDEALLKRPSRFDRVFRLGLPALREREEYCRRLLARPALAGRLFPEADLGNLARRLAEASEGFTPAHLKEAILSAALITVQDGEEPGGQPQGVLLEQVESLRAYLRSARNPEQLGDMSTPERAFGFHA